MGTSFTSLLERMKKERNDCPFVFQDEFGKAIDPDRVNKILRAAQEGAGVQFRLHSLRHHHSSLLVQVCLALGLVAFLACCLPAYRVARTNPLTGLRYE